MGAWPVGVVVKICNYPKVSGRRLLSGPDSRLHSRGHNARLGRRTLLCMAFVLLIVFLFVPWQVAFLGCWFMQLLNCAACAHGIYNLNSTSHTALEKIPRNGGENSTEPSEDGTATSGADLTIPKSPTTRCDPVSTRSFHQNSHILLFMTWLLPLTAPVLAVWVRTLLTAGYTVPFTGDHNVLKVLPILWLINLLGRKRMLETR